MLFGLGGMGKTQDPHSPMPTSSAGNRKCSACIPDKRGHIGGINPKLQKSGLRAEATRMMEQDQAKVIDAVKRWFETHDQWLPGSRQCQRSGYSSALLAPQTSRGHILLTTWCASPGGSAQPLEILPLDSEEGALLVLRRADLLRDESRLSDSTDDNRDAAITIATELGGLPLAIDQAGAYIEATQIAPADYLQRYQEESNRIQLLADEAGLDFRNYPKTSPHLRLAFDEVQKVNPAAADLFRLCSFLASEAIPEELVVEAAKTTESPLRELNGVMKLDAAIRDATRFSLLRCHRQSNTLSTHRLVQVIQRGQLDAAARYDWEKR